MKTALSQTYTKLLLEAPLGTPQLVKLGTSKETVLAMRVEELFSFRRPGINTTVQLLSYQAKEGIWVIVVTFCITGCAASPLTGILYLNPREARALELLRSLTTQERFPFLFFSPRLRVTVSQQALWSIHQRQEVRLLLTHFHPSLKNGQRTATDDPEFERARQEFEQVSAGRNLQIPGLTSGPGPLSPSRGVVLE